MEGADTDWNMIKKRDGRVLIYFIWIRAGTNVGLRTR